MQNLNTKARKSKQRDMFKKLNVQNISKFLSFFFRYSFEFPADKQNGFTLPELIVTIGFMAILFGFVTLNVINAQHKASVNSEVIALIADIKSQQTKAMIGSTDGRVTADTYGVHFESSNYVLFHGASYLATDSATITLDPSIQFTNILFPNANLIFSQGSGEISDFVNGSNSVTISAATGTGQETITLNKYGVIVSVQ